MRKSWVDPLTKGSCLSRKGKKMMTKEILATMEPGDKFFAKMRWHTAVSPQLYFGTFTVKSKETENIYSGNMIEKIRYQKDKFTYELHVGTKAYHYRLTPERVMHLTKCFEGMDYILFRERSNTIISKGKLRQDKILKTLQEEAKLEAVYQDFRYKKEERR